MVKQARIISTRRSSGKPESGLHDLVAVAAGLPLPAGTRGIWGEMHDTIVQCLATFAAERGIRVLYACESGSRAWGFASRDSDWDVRFFFVRPREEYLRVHLPADHLHVDLPGDIDLSGWDLRKALHHAGKSSASVLEWLGSPMVYAAVPGFAEEMRQLAGAHFCAKPTVHHYLGLAKQLWAQAGEGAELNGKKCLYVMRATLCARWALTYDTPPPVAFAELLPLLGSAALRDEILQFVTRKELGGEKDSFPVSEALRGYLAATRAACEEEVERLVSKPTDHTFLDAFFQRMLTTLP
jgi:uncharacterized protein